jgi:ribosomal-protein-serine acetyltransferase
MFSYDLGGGAELRMLERRHGAEFLIMVKENQEFFGEWLGWAYLINSVDEAEHFIGRGVDRYADDGLPWIGIWLDGRMAGGILFFPLEGMIKATKIGYWLAEWANGRGLMTRAIRPVLQFVFEELKLNRIGLEAETGNLKSKAVAERLGFQFEGIRRDGWRSEDGFVDIAVYSMLARDWRNRMLSGEAQ